MKKPLIGVIASGITGNNFNLTSTYADAIYRAGGCPLMIHYIDDEEYLDSLVSRLDGVVFSGGADIDPAYFDELPVPGLGSVNQQRDLAEQALYNVAVLKHKKPILAICRGMQVLNVFMGGALYQDIDTQYGKPHGLHTQRSPMATPTHEIDIVKGSPLHKALGKDTARVNTYHHQAISRLAADFKPMAHAADGIIEAVYNENYPSFMWCFQFHPEALGYDHEVSKAAFDAFIAACKN